MDKAEIEQEARRRQYEIWTRRDVRYSLGVPDIPTLFDPRNVADHCGLYFDTRPRLDTDYAGGGEAAGIWQRDRSTVLVSTRFSYETQRFTAGHEIGSGLQNRLGLGWLNVRGRGAVFRTLLLKVSGGNILRAATSAKLRALIAKLLKTGWSGPFGQPRLAILACLNRPRETRAGEPPPRRSSAACQLAHSGCHPIWNAPQATAY